MDLQLRGKLALVTGSTAGIGFAIAKTLAGEGARVIVNGRTPERVADAVRAIEGDVIPFAADLSGADAARRTFERFPALDILVNSLGVYGAKPFEELADEAGQAILE